MGRLLFYYELIAIIILAVSRLEAGWWQEVAYKCSSSSNGNSSTSRGLLRNIVVSKEDAGAGLERPKR